ncbi:ABC transporter permease subunit [Paenibacillus sp. HB172176]|uniref:ABC transporter permease n=1 Tax=Paenibacillus sp. HB172176 TaxID=2493690 RepID=UPI001439A1B6|nr:ABC transporter permease subunit [Paenibacillus sp. HB172176]
MNNAGTNASGARLRRKRRFKQNIPWLLMFLPVVAFFLIFKYAPMVGLIIAFKQYTFFEGVWGSKWVGFDNFRLLFLDPSAFRTIRNTLVLSVLGITITFPFPIALAILFNEVRQLAFKKTAQTLLYLPHFLSWVVVGGLVVTMFSEDGGIVNHLWQSITGHTYPFLYKEGSWIAIFIGSGIWKSAGFGAIIYLAALTTIDPSLYEAAAMDGASKWRKIWHITLPGIRPTIVLMMILSVGNVLEVGFDQIYNLQNSVVSNVSEVISTYIFRVGLQGAQFSLTTAMGLFESLVGLVLVLAMNAVARRFKQGLW